MMTTLLVLARMLHIGSALLIVSLLYFRQVIFRPDGTAEFGSETIALFSRRITRWLIGVFLVQVVSGGVWFWIVAADISDNSLRDVLDFGLLKTVFGQTQFGQLWLGRMAMGIALGILLLAAGRSEHRSRGHGSTWRWLALVAGGLLLVSLAWAGHAASGVSHRALHLSADIGHLAIASVWPAGLLPLALFLNTAVKTGPPSQLACVVATLHRFSRTSLIAVVLLSLTGFANACFLIPSFPALFTSTYGQLLLGKIALFLAMVGLGALNRFHHLPDLDPDTPTPSDFDRLRRAILIENLLGLIVLLIVGAMGATAPPQAKLR